MKSNLTLIGMPGAGKSTTGIILAKVLSFGFIDTDILIQINRQKSLQQIIDESDHFNLRKIEEEEILKINVENQVIATGGSAVYSEKAMSHLKSISLIVYLKVGLEDLVKRLHNYNTRGIARPKDQTLRELFNERQVLYNRYAELSMDGNTFDQDEIAMEISKQYKQRGYEKRGQRMGTNKKQIVVTVIGKDEIGIVAKVATALAQSNVNLIDINQKILGDEIFAMTLLADRMKSSLSLAEITERINESIKGMSLKVTVQDSEVFQFMHRV